jgi:hypothetical protein
MRAARAPSASSPSTGRVSGCRASTTSTTPASPSGHGDARGGQTTTRSARTAGASSRLSTSWTRTARELERLTLCLRRSRLWATPEATCRRWWRARVCMPEWLARSESCSSSYVGLHLRDRVQAAVCDACVGWEGCVVRKGLSHVRCTALIGDGPRTRGGTNRKPRSGYSILAKVSICFFHGRYTRDSVD